MEQPPGPCSLSLHEAETPPWDWLPATSLCQSERDSRHVNFDPCLLSGGPVTRHRAIQWRCVQPSRPARSIALEMPDRSLSLNHSQQLRITTCSNRSHCRKENRETPVGVTPSMMALVCSNMSKVSHYEGAEILGMSIFM